MGSAVKLTWNQAHIDSISKDMVKGLFKMGYDIANQARKNAPYVTGTLRNTIRVQEGKNNTLEVIAGGSFGGRKVPYAWKREQGPNKNPDTEHYMENAAKLIMAGDYISKYFKGAIK